MKTTQYLLLLVMVPALAACQPSTPSTTARGEMPARTESVAPRIAEDCLTVLDSELTYENGGWWLYVGVQVHRDCGTIYRQGFTLKAVRCSGKSYVATLPHDYALEPGSYHRMPLHVPVPGAHCFTQHTVQVAYAE